MKFSRLSGRQVQILQLLLFGLALVLVVLASCGVNPAERNNTGNWYYGYSDYAGALDAYYAAQVAAPDRPEFYYNAAHALAERGDLQAALAALEQALILADEDLMLKTYYSLGNIYYQMGMFTDAAEYFREVLVRRPDDQEARYNYELAINRVPTPTALEQKTEPEEGLSDPEVTPTPDPAGIDGPTPTPPVQEAPPASLPPVAGSSDFSGGNPSTLTPRPEGEMSLEEARRLLDAVQQNQQTLREFLQQGTTPEAPPERDW